MAGRVDHHVRSVIAGARSHQHRGQAGRKAGSPSAPTPLAQARERCRAAYYAAREVDVPGLCDRWYSDVLLASRGQPADRATAMLTRVAIIFEVMAEKGGWPAHVRGFRRRWRTAVSPFGSDEAGLADGAPTIGACHLVQMTTSVISPRIACRTPPVLDLPRSILRLGPVAFSWNVP